MENLPSVSLFVLKLNKKAGSSSPYRSETFQSLISTDSDGSGSVDKRREVGPHTDRRQRLGLDEDRQLVWRVYVCVCVYEQ